MHFKLIVQQTVVKQMAKHYNVIGISVHHKKYLQYHLEKLKLL